MLKVNFAKIEVKTITGDVDTVDMRQPVGNMLYMQGSSLPECELGTAIYHSDGEMEIDDKQAETVRRYATRLPYVFRIGILTALKQ